MAYSRTLNHFTSMQELATIWASSTSYVVNQLVIENNFLYRCAVAHTSSGSFQTDLAAGNWERVSSAENGINWASSTYYVLNQLVIENDKLYKCLVAHTSSGSFITDLQAARWVEISASEAGVFNYIGNPDAEVDTSGWMTYAESDAVTFQDTGDTVTLNNHGLSNGNEISFTSITSTTGISINTRYFVVSATTNTFQVASSSGGSALPLTTNGSGTMVRFVPKTGSGGSPNITWSRSIVSPLRGDADFNLVKDAANRQGQGVEYDFTIDNADLAKVLTVTFDYEVVSGTLATGDVTVYLIQDPSGTPLVIQPAGYQVQGATVGTKMRQIATFQTSSTVKSYRLCLHVSSVSATAYTLAVDNVVVGPQVVQYGAPVTDWQDYTPTITHASGGITNATITGKYRRVGDSLEGFVSFLFTNTSAAFSRLIIALPSGLSIDTNKLSIPAGGATTVGTGGALDSGAASTLLHVLARSTTTVELFAENAAGTYIAESSLSNTVPYTFGVNDYIAASFRVPILGWSSTVQMSNDTDTRVVAASYKKTSNQTVTGNTTDISFQTSVIDTHGAFNGTAFIAPVSGIYDIGGVIGVTSGSVNIVAFVNGVSRTIIGTTLTASNTAISGLVSLNAGDSLTIRSESSITVFGQASGLTSFFSIKRLSGPSAIAASETVAASYYLSANQAVTANVTLFNFDSREFDTHGSVTTGAAWRFTAPISGLFSIQGAVFSSADCNIYLRKNGTQYKHIGSSRAAPAGVLSGVIRLNAGDYIDVLSNDSVTISGGALPGATARTHISIARIGN